MGSRGILAYGCASVILGLLFVGLTIGAHNLGAGVTAGLFALFASLGLLCLARLAGRRLSWQLDWTRVLICALMAVAVLGGGTFAMLRIGAGLTAFVISSVSLFATLAAQLTGRTPLSGPVAVGLVLTLLGLLLVASAPVGDPSWRFIIGFLNALVVAIIAGASGRWMLRLAARPDAVETTVVALLIASVPLFGFAAISPVTGDLWSIPLVIALALGCGLLLLVVMSDAASGIPARATTTLPAVGAVLAALGGVVLLGEQVSAVEWVGAALILAGTAVLPGLLDAFLPSARRP